MDMSILMNVIVQVKHNDSKIFIENEWKCQRSLIERKIPGHHLQIEKLLHSMKRDGKMFLFFLVAVHFLLLLYL